MDRHSRQLGRPLNFKRSNATGSNPVCATMKNWGTKVDVTTECPECKKPFSRTTYLEAIIGGTCLELCPKCIDSHTDENGDFIIEMRFKYG